MLFTRLAKRSIACLVVICMIKTATAQNSDTLIYPDEKHFKNIQQLTFNGDNAEAYWSYDDKQVIFQRKNEKEGIMCDRMFTGIIPQIGAPFQFKQLGNGTWPRHLRLFFARRKAGYLCFNPFGW